MSELQQVVEKETEKALGATRKILSRDDIIKADDIKREYVDMEPFGWGGAVYVQGMTGKQRGRFEADLNVTKGKDQHQNWVNFRAKLVAMCVVDGDGTRLLREQDVDALNEKSAAALDHLCNIAQRLSGYRKQDVDDITKNSQEGMSDGS